MRRTAQWGGEGRPESFNSLINLVLASADNCYTESCKKRESNQLAAVDFRWRLPTEHPMSIYVQVMGEDEAGYLPSKKTHLAGFSSDFIAWDIPVKYYIEYSDTTTNFSGEFNVTYNHCLNLLVTVGINRESYL